MFSGFRFSGGLLESGLVVCESGSVADFSASERSRLSLARVGRVWERYSVKDGGWRETGWKAESMRNTRHDTQQIRMSQDCMYVLQVNMYIHVQIRNETSCQIRYLYSTHIWRWRYYTAQECIRTGS